MGEIEVFPPRSTDDEASALLDELSGLQTWVTLLSGRGIPKVAEAIDLIQRTRIFIIERAGRKPQ